MFSLHSPGSRVQKEVALRRAADKKKLFQEEQDYVYRDFNPVNGLTKTSSTAKLIEKHGDTLGKIADLQRRA